MGWLNYMTLIKGTTVALINKIKIGEDPFGKSIYEYKKIIVENVLISPTLSDDIINSQTLEGKKAVYTLAIPKEDKNEWENQEVIFFGKRWKTFGKVTQGLDHLLPLEWNKKVMVETYE